MPRPHILIVSPASARENNGNWQTASRWQRFLRDDYRVAIARDWQAADGGGAPDLLVALHARRSAPALAAFKAAFPRRPALLVLTGTDLYRDVFEDDRARDSLALADALVVLQPDGLRQLAPLPGGAAAKAQVIYQSAPRLRARAQHRGAPCDTPCDIVMIGHLRPEKDPLAYMRAAALVTLPGVRLLHVGAALDPALAHAARAAQEAAPRYRWLGALPHTATRRLLRRCHAMAIASRMEGGANVIIEAVTSGVPVLASDVGGNRGMLGDDYAGLFPAGNAAALAGLIERSAQDPAFHARLRRQCAARAGLFRPAAERARLLELVDNLLTLPHGGASSSQEPT
ncbi:TIGR04348 family glycosyltransferase [Massilia forsythiae]|uniref:TIGR04348 family glycosyltransferase n=1 Tax=Massilia forsythiae TaxID=2728020 RepID=A0A7Z2W186_9BURK|nr:selenoneine biosynthesis selenosugar synthase SenB [Massilia forsythiae]QJE02913.1 TIGR04348 family glycosyltransferase [Massilia forsythiae]